MHRTGKMSDLLNATQKKKLPPRSVRLSVLPCTTNNRPPHVVATSKTNPNRTLITMIS